MCIKHRYIFERCDHVLDTKTDRNSCLTCLHRGASCKPPILTFNRSTGLCPDCERGVRPTGRIAFAAALTIERQHRERTRIVYDPAFVKVDALESNKPKDEMLLAQPLGEDFHDYWRRVGFCEREVQLGLAEQPAVFPALEDASFATVEPQEIAHPQETAKPEQRTMPCPTDLLAQQQKDGNPLSEQFQPNVHGGQFQWHAQGDPQLQSYPQVATSIERPSLSHSTFPSNWPVMPGIWIERAHQQYGYPGQALIPQDMPVLPRDSFQSQDFGHNLGYSFS